MDGTEVLFLHGSPGSGKTTLAEALAEQLRVADQPNAVIDLDEISRVYPPPQDDSFSRRGLKSIWPNFAAIHNLKVIIPTVIGDAKDHKLLVDAVAPAKTMVCELTAPEFVLKERVAAREPNEYWQNRLQKWVDVYHQRNKSQRFDDFQITTYGKSIEVTAKEIMKKVGWLK